MKFIVLFTACLFIFSAVNALQAQDLDSIYSGYFDNLKNRTGVMDIFMSGFINTEMGDFQFKAIARDFNDSVSILTFYRDTATGDSSFIKYSMKRNYLKAELSTDMADIENTTLAIEPFFVYRGHHLGVLLSSSFRIEENANDYLIISDEQKPLIDSILIDKTVYLPRSFRVHRYNYDLKMYIDKYREPVKGVFIPDIVYYVNGADTVYRSHIDSIQKVK